MMSRPYLLEPQSGGNGADSAGVLAFLGFILYIAFMVRMFLPMIGNIPFFSSSEPTLIPAIVEPTRALPAGFGGFVIHPAPTFAGVAVVASTPTPYPTYTPFPTFTPSVNWLQGTVAPTQNSFAPSQVNFMFSYYFPALVSQPGMEANCHPDNYIFADWSDTKIVGCKDVTASGLPWSHYLRGRAVDGFAGGVAVPYYPDTNNPLYPMGAVLVVSSPPILAGRYLVMDICPACDDYIHDKGVLFLDFLAEGMPDGVTWWDLVKVDEVIYPQ